MPLASQDLFWRISNATNNTQTALDRMATSYTSQLQWLVKQNRDRFRETRTLTGVVKELNLQVPASPLPLPLARPL